MVHHFLCSRRGWRGARVRVVRHNPASHSTSADAGHIVEHLATTPICAGAQFHNAFYTVDARLVHTDQHLPDVPAGPGHLDPVRGVDRNRSTDLLWLRHLAQSRTGQR